MSSDINNDDGDGDGYNDNGKRNKLSMIIITHKLRIETKRYFHDNDICHNSENKNYLDFNYITTSESDNIKIMMILIITKAMLNL